MERKTRTREHVIADLSVNHVERHLILAGHTTESTRRDYGYDMIVFTFDEHGHPENGMIYIQLKATDHLKETKKDGTLWFQAHMSDVDLWIDEAMPVIFILYDAQQNVAYWLYVQDYFYDMDITKLGKSVVVHIPKDRLVNQQAIHEWIGYKNYILNQVKGLKRREQGDDV